MAVPEIGAEILPVTRSLGDGVLQRLSEAILDGTLAPGEVLRTADLQRWLGVSRTPIREALGRLASVGIVETHPGRFTRVSRIDLRATADTLTFFGFHGGVAFRMAAEHMTDAHAVQAVELVEQMKSTSAANDVQSHLEASRTLVDLAVDVADNQILCRIAGQMNLMIAWNLRLLSTLPGSTDTRRANLSRLSDAIRNRDSDYAEFAFRALYQPSDEFAARTFDENGQPRVTAANESTDVVAHLRPHRSGAPATETRNQGDDMGIDDLVNTGKEFLEQNKDKIQEVLKSNKAEEVSDTVLDAGADFVKKLTPDAHDAKVDDVRATVDKSVGSE